MNLKTFRAKSMAAALADVKRELGKDAVILHTRAYRVGAVMGLGGHDEYEITAADSAAARGPTLRQASEPAESRLEPVRLQSARVEPKAPQPATSHPGLTPNVNLAGLKDLPPKPKRSTLATPLASPPASPIAVLAQEAQSVPSLSKDDFTPSTFTSLGVGQSASAMLAAAMTPAAVGQAPLDVGAQVKPVPPTTPAKVAGLATKADFAPTDPQAFDNLRDELGSIRRLVGQLLTETRRAAAGSGTWGSLIGSAPLSQFGLGEPLMEQSVRLQEAGLRMELIDRVIGAVRDELTPDELSDPSIVALGVQRHVAALMPTAGVVARAGLRMHPASGTQRPLVIALVGPTGVGKTTTIAKLAAMYALKHGATVGLVTCDTYRIAAVDQLRTYASIMNLAMKVALTPGEAQEALRSFGECGVILVDSAGRAPQDTPRLDELASFLDAVQPDETHLVLSAGQAEDVLAHAATRFGLLHPTHLLLTKLDEAVKFGVVPNLCSSVGLKVGYVTTGQEVPAQIELAHPDRLARLVLEGKLRP